MPESKLNGLNGRETTGLSEDREPGASSDARIDSSPNQENSIRPLESGRLRARSRVTEHAKSPKMFANASSKSATSSSFRTEPGRSPTGAVASSRGLKIPRSSRA